MAGLNTRGAAEQDVGETKSVESDKSSDWTITAYLGPGC